MGCTTQNRCPFYPARTLVFYSSNQNHGSVATNDAIVYIKIFGRAYLGILFRPTLSLLVFADGSSQEEIVSAELRS